MEIIREDNKILVKENDKKVLEMCYIADEFMIILYREEPIKITKELDESLYSNLKNILQNRYEFQDENSIQTENEIVWLSDIYCEMRNQNYIKDINRLIIEKKENEIVLTSYNPYFKERGIKKDFNLIAFSPKGHGRYSENLETGLTFQDDIVYAYSKILNNEIVNTNNKTRTRK